MPAAAAWAAPCSAPAPSRSASTPTILRLCASTNPLASSPSAAFKSGIKPSMADFTIKRLNHLVLWVRDAQRSMAFYRDVLGFSIVEAPSPQAVFLRANGSDNHHDLGLFGVGPDVPGPS